MLNEHCSLKEIIIKYRLLAATFLLSMNSIAHPISKNNSPITGKIVEIEKLLNVSIGVAIYDITANDIWHYNGDNHFPLMSTFKTLACAKLLADVDKGFQSLNTEVDIDKSSLIAWSPITEKFVGKKITLEEACSATMLMSDNTAANIVLRAIGGPKELTQFMQGIGDNSTRLDRIEPELNEALLGDERDTTTPKAIVKSLHSILFGDVLSQASKVQLKQWMINNKVTGSLLRSVLPPNWTIADRSGAGGFGSRGITAVVWSDKRSPMIISIYLTQTTASFTERNKAIADIGKMIFTVYKEEKLNTE